MVENETSVKCSKYFASILKYLKYPLKLLQIVQFHPDKNKSATQDQKVKHHSTATLFK